MTKKEEPKKEEKPKKESLESRLNKRKEHIKKTFIKCLKENNLSSKFNYNKYLLGTGGKGLLCDALGDFNSNDRVLFQEVLKDLKKDKILYHIGGCVYILN